MDVVNFLLLLSALEAVTQDHIQEDVSHQNDAFSMKPVLAVMGTGIPFLPSMPMEVAHGPETLVRPHDCCQN